MFSYRHRLAAFFEPRSLVVIADREMPHVLTETSALAGRYAFFKYDDSTEWALPKTLAFLEPSHRLDLVVLSLKQSALATVLERLASWQPRALLLLANSEGIEHQAQTMALVRQWASAHRCYVIGPNAFGIQRPALGLNASLTPTLAANAKVALLSQSRSLSAAVLDWADDVGAGFSCVVSLGAEIDISLVDVLGFFAVDPRTNSIAVIADDTVSARKFSSALHAAAAVKPVVILPIDAVNTNDSPERHAVFEALVRRVGAVRIHYFVQLFSALKVLVYARRPKGGRLALLSNGEGAAGLAAEVIRRGKTSHLATLQPHTIKALSEQLGSGDKLTNPVITYAALNGERLRDVLLSLNADENVDGILVLLAPDPLSDLASVTQVLVELTQQLRKPILSCLTGERSMRPLRYRLDDAGVPAFRTPDTAANAFDLLASYHYGQVVAQQVLPADPLSVAPQLAEARALVEARTHQAQRQLGEADIRSLLSYFHIPIQLVGAKQYEDKRVEAELSPLSIRVRRQAQLGPYFSVSPGGPDSGAATNYRNLELPPLNRVLARQLLERCSGWAAVYEKQLSPTVLEALKDSLERISELVSELPDIESVTIDPLTADGRNLYSTHIRIGLAESSSGNMAPATGYAHLAIHPYPRHLVQEQHNADGTTWLMRPIRPEDAQALQKFVRALSFESRYMRFVSMMRELSPKMLSRYTRIDYDRELALVATVMTPNPKDRGRLHESVVGFAHYLRNNDGLGAEYALVIADDWQRCGLGTRLMQGLILAAKHQGLHYINGYVLAKNTAMLRLMQSLSFTVERDREDPTLRQVWLRLRDETVDH